jgi:hypothetical protein
MLDFSSGVYAAASDHVHWLLHIDKVGETERTRAMYARRAEVLLS